MHPSTPIETVSQLQAYLQVAIRLEHATIPPYLTAAYTAKIESNKASIDAITAVAKEEMLHLTLAANLLNAVGGSPDLLGADFVPSYPCPLPSGETDFQVSIESFSEQAIDTFLNIERPDEPDDSDRQVGCVHEFGDIAYVAKCDLRPETRGTNRGLLPSLKSQDGGREIELHFWSIGAFYNAIRKGFQVLTDKCGEDELFDPTGSKQVNPKYYFSAGGDLDRIVNLETALNAIDLISIQGEGYTNEVDGMGDELAHYYRFEQIKLGKYYLKGDTPHQPQGGNVPRDYEAVFPIRKDAKVEHYRNFPDIDRQARLFNGRYKRFLSRLHRAFNGEPDLFANSYRDMYQIKREMEYLIRNPLPGTRQNAAPTFEMDACIDPPEEQ
jgi:hypothetical protein